MSNLYNVEDNREVDVNKDGIPENFNVGNFIFTKKTITYDGKTIQLKNVTKIQKYSFSENWKPVYKVSDDLRKKAFIGLGASMLVLFLLGSIQFIATIGAIAFCVAAGILIYSYNERNKKKPFTENYYGLIIETSSGKSENLLTQSSQFISALFHQVTMAMNDEGPTKIVANFNSHEIRYENNSTVEKLVVGDSFEGISDSTIYNRSNVVEDKLDLKEILREEANK